MRVRARFSGVFGLEKRWWKRFGLWRSGGGGGGGVLGSELIVWSRGCCGGRAEGNGAPKGGMGDGWGVALWVEGWRNFGLEC